jgi:predicted nucleic acid-binding protein
MKALVIDGSTTIGFLLKDEQGASPLKALQAIENGVATFVPAHWSVEVANGLIMAERRKRASQADVTEALALIAALPVECDDETKQRAVSDTAALALRRSLSRTRDAPWRISRIDRRRALQSSESGWRLNLQLNTHLEFAARPSSDATSLLAWNP